EAETRERMHLWNVSQDLLAVADVGGNVISVNPAWTATLGWAEADLLGKSAEWLIHPDDRERSTAERGHPAAGRLTVHFDSRLRHKDGSYRWISWKAVPEGGRVYAMGRDVTDLKEAENAARDARDDLARVTRQTTLAAMTASIAHEVSQPLSAMIVNAEVG